MRHIVDVRVFSATALLLLVPLMSAHVSALADDATPTDTLPTPTVQIVTPVSTAAPTWTAVVAKEHSVPIATSPPYSPPTVIGSSGTASTLLPKPEQTPTATAVPPAVQTGPTGPGSIPGPTPAELRLDARLRWGHGIPASVRRWAFLIVPAARRYKMDPNLVAAVMTMESNGDPLALSTADARGLMQVLDGPWDPKKNVYTGVRMLARYLREFGTLRLALAAYNAGPNAVLAYNGVPPFRETRDYIIVVRYLYDLFGHRHLSGIRKNEYRSSLLDLSHFADERKKVEALARLGGMGETLAVVCRHFSTQCDSTPGANESFPTDPFWPLGNLPDPLQQVRPPGLSGPGT